MPSYLFDESDDVREVYSQRPLGDDEVVHNAVVLARDLVLFPGDSLALRIPTRNLSESNLVTRLLRFLRGEGVTNSSTCSSTTLAYICTTSDYRNSLGEGEVAGDSEWAVGVFLQILSIAERESQLVLTVKAHRRFKIMRVVSVESPGLFCADLRVLQERLGESASSRASGRGRGVGRGVSSSVPVFASRTFSLQGQVDVVLRELRGVVDEESKLQQLTVLAQRDPLAFSWYLCKNHYALGQTARQRLLAESSCLTRLVHCATALKQTSERDVLACSGCNHPIAPNHSRFSLSGIDGNCGNYVNPHGHVHQTMTVRAIYNPVKSVTIDSREPESKDSWFPDYSWAIISCSNCQRHLGWRFTKADASVPSVIGEGAFDGNLSSVDRYKTAELQYWYWRALLDIAEGAGDAPEDVLDYADWHAANPNPDRPGNDEDNGDQVVAETEESAPSWPPVEGYTSTAPEAAPHPQYSSDLTDVPLVFYGLTSDGCVVRAFRGQEDLDVRYGMDEDTMIRLRRAAPWRRVSASAMRQLVESQLRVLEGAQGRAGEGQDPALLMRLQQLLTSTGETFALYREEEEEEEEEEDGGYFGEEEEEMEQD